MDTKRKLKARRKLACTVRTGRVEERFRALVEQGNYYEAHQTMRAIYQRFLAQGKKEKALNLLRQGGLMLLQKRQWESGTEISITFVRLLREQEHKVTNEILDYIEEIFDCYIYFKEDDFMPHPHVPGMRTTPGISQLSREQVSRLTVMQHNREMFMKAALKWTTIDISHKRGHPRLHWALASAYCEEGELSKCRYHLMYADKPVTLGLILVELATLKGYPSEADLFVTQTVLQLLVLENKEVASVAFQQYCKSHPLFSKDVPLPSKKRPLLNFTRFLILTLDIGDIELYDFICKIYTPVLNRDQSYFKYLEKIRQTSFPDQPSIRPMPSGIFDLLMGGASDGGNGSPNDLFSSLTNMLPSNLFGSPEMHTGNMQNPVAETTRTDDLD